MATTIESSVYTLERSPLYKTVKPYTLRYKPEEDIPQTNKVNARHAITAASIRDHDVNSFKLDSCGFQVMNLSSKLSYEEFWNHEKIQAVYVEEVKEALKKELGAKSVYVLDYAVRKRDPEFPISHGGEYVYDQPTQLAHIDFTAAEGERIVKVLFGDRADEVLQGRWQAVNVWKPIKGPLNDWPLGVCDARTVDMKNDALASDIVFDEFFTENWHMVHSPRHQWYYLPDQTISETLVFKSADSDPSAVQGCAHTGFYNPNAQPGELRESLDLRTFVFYADLDEYPPVVGSIFQPSAHIT